jgi:hypothetical protein
MVIGLFSQKILYSRTDGKRNREEDLSKIPKAIILLNSKQMLEKQSTPVLQEVYKEDARFAARSSLQTLTHLLRLGLLGF